MESVPSETTMPQTNVSAIRFRQVLSHDFLARAPAGHLSKVHVAVLCFNRGVSAEEFRTAALQRFHMLDLDHKGQLTLPDLLSVRRAALFGFQAASGHKAGPG